MMVSEWLELDAADDWVRHDAEIVRFSFSLAVAHSLKRIFASFYNSGPTAGTSVRLVSEHPDRHPPCTSKSRSCCILRSHRQRLFEEFAVPLPLGTTANI